MNNCCNNRGNCESKEPCKCCVGPMGPAGPVGATGAQGPAGPVGATGAQGPAGPVGATGAQGPAGPVGATGAQGPTGPAGPAGAGFPSGMFSAILSSGYPVPPGNSCLNIPLWSSTGYTSNGISATNDGGIQIPEGGLYEVEYSILQNLPAGVSGSVSVSLNNSIGSCSNAISDSSARLPNGATSSQATLSKGFLWCFAAGDILRLNVSLQNTNVSIENATYSNGYFAIRKVSDVCS